MSPNHADHLTTRINELRQSVSTLADGGEFEELIRIVHHPGHTSVAEHRFELGMVDSMLAHTSALIELKRALLAASREVRNE